jgi:hypothetical protein
MGSSCTCVLVLAALASVSAETSSRVDRAHWVAAFKESAQTAEQAASTKLQPAPLRVLETFKAAASRAADLASAAERKHRSAVSAIQTLQGKGKPLTQALVRAYEETGGVAAAAGASAITAQLRARADYGPNSRLLPLATACFTAVGISEKLTKGGSATSTPKTYAYRVCPFANVSQREVLPDEWSRAEDASKGIVPEVAAAVGADGGVRAAALANRSAGSLTMLGMWRGWVAHSDLLSHYADGLTGPTSGAEDARVGLALPPSSDGTDGALYFEGVDGGCSSGGMRAQRRSWVLLTCPAALRRAVELDVLYPEGWPSAAAAWGEEEGADAAVLTDGPSLTQRVLGALHPFLPTRFLPRRLNGGWEEGGSVLHVAEDSLCQYIAWVGHAAACTRRGAKMLKAAASAEREKGA